MGYSVPVLVASFSTSSMTLLLIFKLPLLQFMFVLKWRDSEVMVTKPILFPIDMEFHQTVKFVKPGKRCDYC